MRSLVHEGFCQYGVCMSYTRVLDYSERAYFFNIGDQGKLLENFGTPNRSSVIEMASGLATIEYEQGDKTSIIEFRTQNIKGVYLNVGDE